MKKLQVVVTTDSQYAVSDWEVESWYKEQLKHGGTAYVATSLMLNELRVGVRLGELEPFSFEFEGETINCLETGELNNWPNGLGDHVIIQMDVLLEGISREQARTNQYQQAG